MKRPVVLGPRRLALVATGGPTAAVMTVVPVSVASAATAFTRTVINQSNGTVTSGDCVDIFGASTSDNAAVIQWPCHSATNQQFRLRPVSISGATNTFNVLSVNSER